MLQELFGGGVYELIARDDAKIVARQKYKLSGASRPLHPQPDPQPVAAPPPVVMQGGSGDPGLMNLLVALLQGQSAERVAQANAQKDSMQLMLTMMQTQAAQQTQFLTTMMSTSKEDARAFVESMGKMSTQQTQMMAEAMRGGGGGGGSSKDDLLETLTTGIEMGAKMADKPNELAETLGAAVQGMQALNEIKKGGPSPGANGAAS